MNSYHNIQKVENRQDVSVDLSILRLAVFEIIYRDDIPNSVAINEAVELAKKYSGDQSPSFVNGILGSISSSLGEVNDDE